jgi:hypothetical protein
MLSKALEWASVPIGNMKRHSFLRAFEIKSYIRRYVKMLCKWVSLSKGAQLGILEGDSLAGTFRQQRKVGIFTFLSWTQRVLRF